MSSRRRFLRGAALSCLILFSLYAAVQNGLFVQQLSAKDSGKLDPVSNWEVRLKPVLSHLPPDVTVLGYVADWDLPEVQYNLVDQDQEYVLTQYSLAPRMVQPGIDHEWIIGNFVDPGYRAWLDSKIGKYKLFEFGKGIFLIHRLSQ